MRKCYVDAIRFTGENADEVVACMGGEYQGKFKYTDQHIFVFGSMQIFPRPGDWIVRDPGGFVMVRDPEFFGFAYVIDDPDSQLKG
jgi:hypothetical protein